MLDPQQELFIRLYYDLKEQGYDVYDGILPPDGTPYPFIYMAETDLIDEANKGAVFGNVTQRLHVWHDNTLQRGLVSVMLLAIKNACRRIDRTDNFTWQIVGISQRILPDTTTKTPTLHGVVDVEWKFS